MAEEDCYRYGSMMRIDLVRCQGSSLVRFLPPIDPMVSVSNSLTANLSIRARRVALSWLSLGFKGSIHFQA